MTGISGKLLYVSRFTWKIVRNFPWIFNSSSIYAKKYICSLRDRGIRAKTLVFPDCQYSLSCLSQQQKYFSFRTNNTFRQRHIICNGTKTYEHINKMYEENQLTLPKMYLYRSFGVKNRISKKIIFASFFSDL